MTQVIDKAHLAAVVTGTDRERIAAFLRDDATAFAPNGFPTTTAGAARHIWRGHAFEFPILGVATAGLSCLMEALTRLPIGEPLTRHYLKRHHPNRCRDLHPHDLQSDRQEPLSRTRGQDHGLWKVQHH